MPQASVNATKYNKRLQNMNYLCSFYKEFNIPAPVVPEYSISNKRSAEI
ncbi:hypothetical protein BN135_447 [Cronobacter muytjensii 530]